MSFVDREIVCLDCTQSFVFTAGEQEFYERKGFKEEPKRCKPCREVRKQRRSDTPVTPRAPRAGAASVPEDTVLAGNGGFGFRGNGFDGEDAARSDSELDGESVGNRARSMDDEDDNIGNHAPGIRAASPAPARPRAAPPRGAANEGGRRERGIRAERGPSNGASAGAGNAGADRRELHDATCAQCNGGARFPFKPVPGRPVYCRDCYASRAASAGGR